MVVIGHAQKRQKVAKQIDGCHRVLDDRPRERDQQPVLDDPGDIHGQSRSLSDKQEHGEIQSESAEGIGAEDDEIEVEARGFPQHRVLHEDPGNGEESQAAGGDVVQRGNGVQGDTFGGEEDLDQDEPCGLESDGTQLENNPPGVEFGLAVGGDGDTHRDGEHVGHDF